MIEDNAAEAVKDETGNGEVETAATETAAQDAGDVVTAAQDPIEGDVIAGLQSRCDRLQEELAQANSDLKTVTAERDALKAAADAAAAAPKARGAKAPKARNCGPVVNSDGEEVPTPKPRDLHELIQVANKVEVLFSADGKKESTKLAAQEISGSAWSVRESGLVLTLDLAVRGPATIAGYGLMLDGELVAYRERFEVLKIADGANASLAGDVVF